MLPKPQPTTAIPPVPNTLGLPWTMPGHHPSHVPQLMSGAGSQSTSDPSTGKFGDYLQSCKNCQRRGVLCDGNILCEKSPPCDVCNSKPDAKCDGTLEDCKKIPDRSTKKRCAHCIYARIKYGFDERCERKDLPCSVCARKPGATCDGRGDKCKRNLDNLKCCPTCTKKKAKCGAFRYCDRRKAPCSVCASTPGATCDGSVHKCKKSIGSYRKRAKRPPDDKSGQRPQSTSSRPGSTSRK